MAEAEACTAHGELGALLRREGLYSSHLAAWRIARKEQGAGGLSARTPGPKAKVQDERDTVIATLERDKRRLEKRILQAEAIIAIQKKLSQLLGVELPEPPDDER